MLIIHRDTGQRLVIGDKVVVTLLESNLGHASLGIVAPKHVLVDREEVRKEKIANGLHTFEDDRLRDCLRVISELEGLLQHDAQFNKVLAPRFRKLRDLIHQS